MGQFEFSCPACGHQFLCDTTDVGKQLTCPDCNASITVPDETAAPAEVSTPANPPPVLPGNTATAVPRTSRLAIASLVCSLTCIGWLPGIICGHLARSRIRRDPSLKGGGLATAGLIIGYLFLVIGVGTAAVRIWTFSAAVKQGYENVRHDLATNNFIVVTQTPSTTVSNDLKPLEPVPPGPAAAGNPPGAHAQSGWTSDLSQVSIPDRPVSGKLHGIDFTAKTTLFRNGDLKIRSENGIQLDIYRLGNSIEGQSFDVQSDDNDSRNPRVKVTWNEGGAVQTATFNKGFGMKLQFAQAVNRTVSGKIYLCLPDNSKSCAAGTFKVRLPKPN